MGSLFIVSTPIGNLSEITLRAVETLKQVDVILCEDTRKTKHLINKLNITLFNTIVGKSVMSKQRLISFYEQNEEQRIPQVIEWLKQGKNVALVSNAGTPLISDPGFRLVRECVKHKLPIVPIPGASAVLAGLVVSGLPTDKFMFLGFLPKKVGKKEKLLKKALESEMTVVFYESPFRIIKTLDYLKNSHSGVGISVGRELTKKYEEILRGTPSELIEKLSDKKIKGELVVVCR